MPRDEEQAVPKGRAGMPLEKALGEGPVSHGASPEEPCAARGERVLACVTAHARVQNSGAAVPATLSCGSAVSGPGSCPAGLAALRILHRDGDRRGQLLCPPTGLG